MAFLLVSFLTWLSQILLATYGISVALSLWLFLCLVWFSCWTFSPMSIPTHLYLPFLCFLLSSLFFFSIQCPFLLLNFFHIVVGILSSLLLLSPSLSPGYIEVHLQYIASIYVYTRQSHGQSHAHGSVIIIVLN